MQNKTTKTKKNCSASSLKQGSSKPPKPPSVLEVKFARLWSSIQNSPQLVEEHRFHETRKWRFDFAHLESKTAIEIEGGVWSGGRHTRGGGYIKDAEKYNEAAFAGWAVIRLVGSMITIENCQRIKELIESR
jgi:very-short-patch-repair endonuclease